MLAKKGKVAHSFGDEVQKLKPLYPELQGGTEAVLLPRQVRGALIKQSTELLPTRDLSLYVVFDFTQQEYFKTYSSAS